VGVIREPKDVTSAQFSAYFSVALFLVTGGAGIHEYTEENLASAEILDLSRRVKLVVDDEIEEEFRRTQPRAAKVTVRLKSGEQLYEYVPNLRLMDSKEVDEKFRTLASRTLGDRRTELVIDLARSLDDVPDMARIAEALTAPSVA